MKKVLLWTLYTNEKSSFREIQRLTKISPRVVRRHLDDLVHGGLVRRDKSANWKRGQKIHFSLTPRGERSGLRHVADDIRVAFDRGLGLVRHLAENQRILSEIERAINPVELGEPIVEFTSPPKEFDSKLFLEMINKQKYLREQSRKIRQLLRETLKTVYESYLRLRPLPYETLENDALMKGYKSFLDSLSLPQKAFGDDVALCITSEGEGFMIPTGLLRERGFLGERR